MSMIVAAISEARSLLDRDLAELAPQMRRTLAVDSWRYQLANMARMHGVATVRLAVAVTLTDIMAVGGDVEAVREAVARVGVEDYVSMRLSMQAMTGITDVHHVVLTRGLEYLSGRSGQTLH